LKRPPPGGLFHGWRSTPDGSTPASALASL
jgi:hypothetical protein